MSDDASLPPEAKAPPFRSRSDSEDIRIFQYNQERTLALQEQITELLEKIIVSQDHMTDAMERIASPERVMPMVNKQHDLLVAMNELNKQMTGAGEKLENAVTKLSSAFWGLMKVPVAVVVIGVASWAFLYTHKISENTWLIMLGISVFPWLGDSMSGIAKLMGIRKGNGNGDHK